MATPTKRLTRAEVDDLLRVAEQAAKEEQAWAENALNVEEPYNLEEPSPFSPHTMRKLARALLEMDKALHAAQLLVAAYEQGLFLGGDPVVVQKMREWEEAIASAGLEES